MAVTIMREGFSKQLVHFNNVLKYKELKVKNK